ncbi:D-arabinono-1,4-lactone oxidase [Solwaraspora sp. WMMB335]|uniref:D-arabinono-1,4-lactone oxidase n=1 Tax=Solwaraspora sp. WMMB335 TaxID=3404118 RepID=UPI003B9499F1
MRTTAPPPGPPSDQPSGRPSEQPPEQPSKPSEQPPAGAGREHRSGRQDWLNWAGNQRATCRRVLRPRTVDELQTMVRDAADAGARVKPVGAGHSFTGAACADDHRLELDAMESSPVTVNTGARLVTVPGQMTLHEINALLVSYGLALPNLGDVDRQTIAGAIATGTHGTGATHRGLAGAVDALTLVTAGGQVVSCSERSDPDLFGAARIGLGALGVVTDVTLRCVDAFVLRARERPGKLADVLAGLPDLVDGNDHVEFYWFPYTDLVRVKINNRVPMDSQPLPAWRGWFDDEFLSNTVFDGVCRLGRTVPRLVPALNGICARAVGARTYTGRSDRVFCSSRRVLFTEMEYALPRDALSEALLALRDIVDRSALRVMMPVEVRFCAADDSWLSHSYQRDSGYIAIHQYSGMPYEAYFRAFEQVATSLGGRPHWGKLHYRTAETLRPAYPRFDDFLAVRDRLDPDRMFANDYTAQVLGP